jgi:hypothetical protein
VRGVEGLELDVEAASFRFVPLHAGDAGDLGNRGRILPLIGSSRRP